MNNRKLSRLRDARNSTTYELDFTQKLSPEVQERISDGMQRADEHADGFWKVVFGHCIWQAARKHAELTCDDVLDEIDLFNIERKKEGEEPIQTHNLDAIGPAMKRAAREKLIEPTGRVQRSRRPEKHGIRHTIWKSNVFVKIEP